MKRLLSLTLSLLLLLTAFNVTASAKETPVSVDVVLAVQADGAFLTKPAVITVTDGIAEQYGYTMPKTDHNDVDILAPTFFDALVALHAQMYGDKFTKDTANTYLSVSSYGYLEKAFEKNAAATMFYINGEMSSDDQGTGYLAQTARLFEDDIVEFWFYQDTEYWSDSYAAFDVYEKEAFVDQPFTLTIYRTKYDSNYNAVRAPIDGTDEDNEVTVNLVKDDGSIGAALTNANDEPIVPDKDGSITLTFAEAGEYVVTAQGIVDGYAPLTAPLCFITVRTPATADIVLAVQSDGAFLTKPAVLAVTDGIAEQYGYTMPKTDHNDVDISAPTFFDALVALHAKIYGDKFSKDTANTYLSVSSYGYLEKAFEKNAAATMFYINGEMASDDQGTGYLAQTARLSDDDIVEFWFYQDTEYWSDSYAAFDTYYKNAFEGVPFTLTLYRTNYDSNYNAVLAPIDGTDEDNEVTVNLVKNDGSIGAALTDANDEPIVPDKDGRIALTFDESGEYLLSAQGFVDGYAPLTAPLCFVTVSEPTVPEAITVTHDAAPLLDAKAVLKKGDTFRLYAANENGEATPVAWTTTSSSTVSLDQTTGEVEIIKDLYSGSTTSLYFTATSTLDSTITKKITVQAAGYLLSDSARNRTVALSEDGQTAKTVSVTGGFAGHNAWDYTIPEGVAEPSTDPGTGNSVSFKALRPGTFDVTFATDISDSITDTATVTITGVAVEDPDGNGGKTYLSLSAGEEKPTVLLKAYAADGRDIASWTTSNEDVATVDENGLVKAVSVGSAIIQATDSEGAKGGIKVVVSDDSVPYFESLEFATTAFNTGVWVKDKTFSPTVLSYDLPIKNYSTSSLMLQSSTIYDTEKYTAVAAYTDINGEKQSITVNSGASTTLANQPFDDSELTITLSSKEDPDKKTIYVFHVNRPRDTLKAIKTSTGIVIAPEERSLLATSYNGVSEGVMQKADENGALTSGTGVASGTYYYRTFLYDDASSFRLSLASSTAYAHLRYSADEGETWKELPQGGGNSEAIDRVAGEPLKVLIQVLDDAAYTANILAENDGFFASEPATYTLWLDDVVLTSPSITNAQTDVGDWYPTFDPDEFSFWIVAKNTDPAPVLTYTVSDGSTVMIGKNEQTPDDSGNYTLTLSTSQSSIVVTSADGSFSNTYKIGYRKGSAMDVPDKVVDYLCVGSQYTNASYGLNPETTLSGSLKSLGNFGGYITYYYEKPLVNDPNNKFGMDFYVIGNSNETDRDSMAELGQVYVSEDGETWYALAGSEHYEDTAIWDYTITYTKGEDGRSYWTDDRGNAMDYAAPVWPSASAYPFNDAAKQDSYTYTGIVFLSQLGTIMGDSTSTTSFTSRAAFGYADYYASNVSGTTCSDVNSYVENPSKANGFDLLWAVDENGEPVDVDGKEFHYVKIATASNIHAGAFKEKSTEVTYVIRTTPQEQAVGATAMPESITISDGASRMVVNLIEGQSVYSVNLDDMKYVSLSVNGTSQDDNIYVNNRRIVSDESADGFKITKDSGEKLVRVIVQNGDKEPYLCLLKLTSSAEDSDVLVEGIKIDADGSVRAAKTSNGKTYTSAVGYRIDSIDIRLIAAPGVTYLINGDAPADSYELEVGKNTFVIEATDESGSNETVTLVVTKEKAPSTSVDSTITVKFTLYGDDIHGEEESHTYKENKNDLPIWIEQSSYTIAKGSTVADVFEIALKDAGLSWKNESGNYVSMINGLAEFSNGPLSGWMYLLNGKHGVLGVAEQTLRNGDAVIFHYTDDYTKEQGAESFTDNKNNNSAGLIGGGTAINEYTVTFDTNGGSSIKKQSVAKNGTATEPKAPEKEGYVFDGWYADALLTQKYDFSAKITANITLYASWKEEKKDDTNNTPENEKKVFTETTFRDVAKGAWYYDAVKYVYENDLMQGTDKGFEPDLEMTRAMLVTVLYRIEAPTDKVDVKHSFKDVAADAWYAQAVAWAYNNAIVAGMSGTEFAPDEKVSREQMALILYRYAKMKGYKIDANADLSLYQDAEKISEWALTAVKWAIGSKLINGTSKTEVSPKATATRAQVATILMRFQTTFAGTASE